MKPFFLWLINTVIVVGTSILCRIDKRELAKVPKQGPLILVMNHISSLEVPLLFAHLQPRKITGLAKIETWDNQFMGWLFDLWDAIPVRRGEADLRAIRGCLKVLKEGEMLGIAPEGTRSYHGKLLRGQPGTALIALHAGVPILPVAHWGGEDFPANIKKGKRTNFHIRVGKSFTIQTNGEKVTHELRQEITDEIMGQIAALMPEEYHGEYAGKTGNVKYLKPSRGSVPFTASLPKRIESG